MRPLLAIWKDFLQIGCGDHLKGLEKNRAMVVNGLSLVMLLFMVLFLLLFLFFGIRNWAHLLPAFLLYPTVLGINKKQKHAAAAITFFVGSLLLIAAWCMLNRRSGAEYGLIALGCSTSLLFTKKPAIYVSFLITCITFILYKAADLTMPFVPDPTINYTFLPIAILIAAGSIVFLEMMVFRDLAHHYFKKQNKKYDLLEEAMTAKQLAEEELKTSNEELSALTEQLDWIVKQKSNELQTYLDAINVNVYSAITDLKGNLLKVNDPLLNITGYSSDELLGKNFRMLYAGYHPDSLFTEMVTTIHATQSWRGEIKNKAKNGSYFWIDLAMLPIKNEKGVISYFLLLALPITERKEAEEQKERTIQILEDIAFRTSHKVRGPITRIQGLINLIDNGQIHPDELEKITAYLKVSINEMDVATSELTRFVNTHHDPLIPVTDE